MNIFTTTTYVSKHITGNREHLGKKPSEHGHSVGDVAFHTGNRRNSRFENQRLKKMAIDNLDCV